MDNQENQFISDLCFPVSFHWVICQEPNVLPEGCFSFISLTMYLLNCSNLDNFLHHLTFDSRVPISSHLKLHIWITTVTLGDNVSVFHMQKLGSINFKHPDKIELAFARNPVNWLKTWHSDATVFLWFHCAQQVSVTAWVWWISVMFYGQAEKWYASV